MIKHMKTFRRAVYIFAAFLLVAGCGKSSETPPVQEPQVNQPAPAPPPLQSQASSAKTQAAIGSTVDFTVVKDPFKAYIAEAARAAVKRNRFGQALPILNYDVTQFQVKGIIVGLKENTALILDPAGKPYVVKKGMEIGRNEGKITRITNTYIEIFEQYKDESGKLKKNSIKLTLPKKE